MNYINNPNDMCCCSFDRGDFIRVEKRTVLVDIMGTKVCELGDITPGHTIRRQKPAFHLDNSEL